MFDITQIPNRVLDADASLGVFKDTAGTIPAVNSGDVVKCWVDQSGSSNHFTTSGSNGTPELTLNQFGALPAIYLAPTGNNQLKSALSWSSASQAYTIKIVARAATTGGSYNPFLCFTGTTNAFCGIRVNGIGGQYTVYPSFAAASVRSQPQQSVVVFTLSCDGTNTLPSVDRDTPANATNAAFAIGSPYLGEFPLGSPDESVYVARIIIWSRALTAQEHAQVDSALYAKYSPSPTVAFVGDSLTLGTNSTAGFDYPTQTIGLLNAAGVAPAWCNFGISGEYLSGMVTAASTTEDPYCGQHNASVVCTWGGTNDNTLGASSAKSIYDSAVTYGLARKLFCPQRKVILLSMLPRGTGSTIESTREAFNIFLANDFQVPTPFACVCAANPGVYYADYLIRLDLDPNIGQSGDSTNATYYEQVQQTHLTNLGYGIVAGYVAGAIRSALSAGRAGARLSVGDGITV